MTHINRPAIDIVLIDVAEGRVTDAEVLAMGYARSAWRAYDVRRDSPTAVIAAYWRILEMLPIEASRPLRTVSDADVAAAMARPTVRRIAEHPDHEQA